MNIVRNEIRDLRNIIFEKDNIIFEKDNIISAERKAHQKALAEIAELRRRLNLNIDVLNTDKKDFRQ